MKAELYKQWKENRPFLLPDDEEAELKKKLLQAKARETVTAVKHMRQRQAVQKVKIANYRAKIKAQETQMLKEKGLAGLAGMSPPSSASPKSAQARSALVTAGFSHHDGEEDEDDINHPIMTLADIPDALRIEIYMFLPIVSDRYLQDMRQIHRILNVQDGEVLRNPEFSQTIIEDFHMAVQTPHVNNIGEFALLAMCLGIDPLYRYHHPQHVEYTGLISSVVKEIAFQRDREDSFARWTEYRTEAIESTCTKLRAVLREDLAAWRTQMIEWGARRKDVMYELAVSELEYLWKRCKGIEFIGNPELELDDIRNMFWECDLKVPEGITAEYSQSITVSQAITLGIVDLPWVRGYAWEDRAIPIDDECPDSGNTSPTHQLQGNNTFTVQPSIGALSSSSTSGADRVARIMTQRLMNQEAKQQQLEMERERFQAEQEQFAERQRARHVAATQMTQRLWMTTQQFRHRWHHKFCGCEICSVVPIHRVGLAKENSGAPEDIALCNSCFDDLYSDEGSVAHRMYTWYEVKDLIDNPGVAPSLPSPTTFPNNGSTVVDFALQATSSASDHLQLNTSNGGDTSAAAITDSIPPIHYPTLSGEDAVVVPQPQESSYYPIGGDENSEVPSPKRKLTSPPNNIPIPAALAATLAEQQQQQQSDDRDVD